MVKIPLTSGEIGWIVGCIVGFFGGAVLMLTICLSFGNAFPNFH
jgi:hypothetical protein